MFDNGIVGKKTSTSGSGLDKQAAPMEANVDLDHGLHNPFLSSLSNIINSYSMGPWGRLDDDYSREQWGRHGNDYPAKKVRLD